jgi:TonB family protein
MRKAAVFCIAVVLGLPCSAKEKTPAAIPTSFSIGRHTFVDFGPPFDFYEIITVHDHGSGTIIERILLTPSGGACTQPASLEIASGKSADSVTTVFANKNPCDIPEKALRRELKRRKRFHVFSGAEITLKVQCGERSRLIRADVLDRDMFDANSRTPVNTSWTMRLLQRLDMALGPGPMDKPIFQTRAQRAATPTLADETAQSLAAGMYDDLFAGDRHKPSRLYRDTKKTVAQPAVKLVDSYPLQPVASALPRYPPLAKAAGIGGSVRARVIVGADGNVADVYIEDGHPMLAPSVVQAVKDWKFAPEFGGWQTQITIDFQRNCTAQ